MPSSTSLHADIIVLGGGIAGLGCAIPLAQRGKKVLLIERSDLRGQATPASAGILDPVLGMHARHPMLPFLLKSLREYPRFMRHLRSRTRTDVEFTQPGILYVAKNVKQMRKLRREWKWQSKLGLRIQFWKMERIKKKFPWISKRVLGGIFYPTVGKVNPALLQKALSHYARDLGIQSKRFSNQPLKLILENAGVSGVRFGRVNCYAAAVVNARGCWAGQAPRPLRLPVRPVRGQIVLIKGRSRLPAMIHTMDGFYMVPWSRGHILIGSTVENAGYRVRVESRSVARLLGRAQALMPGLGPARMKKAWAGLRPRSKDDLPIVGRMPFPGLYAAAGYYRSGILMGIRAGQLVARAILTGRQPREIRHLSALRFSKKRKRYGG